MRRLPLILVLLLATGASAGTFTTVEAIEYANVNGHSLLLDLRVPEGDGPHPVIVYLHSGAWITGDRTGGPAIRQAERGYAVASVAYRLAPTYTWPAQIEDVKAAVRWLRANAATHRLDPSRIGVFGTSAGGHLAAMLGTTGDRPEFEGRHLGNAEFSSSVKAVVDFYGPTDLLKLGEQNACYPVDANAWWMPPSLLMGCPIQQCREKTATSNPIHYASPDDPPFLIMQGLRDCLTPYQQSVALHEALVAAGVNSTLIVLANGEHGGDAFNEPVHRATVDEFLDMHVRGAAEPRVRRRAVRR